MGRVLGIFYLTNTHFYEILKSFSFTYCPHFLAACTPTVLGIPQDQWAQLNQQQRTQVIEGYNQRQQAEAQVAPIYVVVDALKTRNSTAKPDKPAEPFPDHTQ